MWMTKVSIQNPVFATMVMVALVVLGIFSYRGLGVESMPSVQFPFAAMEVNYPGASPEAVENDITRPIEDAVNTVSGIKTIRANSWEGRAGVYLEFELSTNMDKAMQDLRDKVALVRPRFPKEAKDPFIARAEGDNERPIATIVLTSTGHDLRALSTMTEQIISKRFQGVAGVGQVKLRGLRARQILISMKPIELNAQGIGVDEVIRAIQATNTNLPAGSISHGAAEQLVRVEGKIKDAREFGKIIVARRAIGPVYLDQVATVVDGEQEELSISRMNGQQAVTMEITKVQDANVVEVGTGILKVAADLQKTLPPDIKLRVLDDESERVQSQLNNVKRTIIEGAVLTMVIVFLFLHSWRSTIITGLTLPISVLASFIAMKAFGFTLNFLTLMALSLCIGLLIDDAIVVRENIVRHLGLGKNHHQAANEGTEEIGLAVMATTFAIIAVFIPIAFMSGIIGRYFLQFGITVAVAVLVSLFVSFTLDPMLSSIWLDPAGDRFKRLPWLGRMMSRIEQLVQRAHQIYGVMLSWALENRIKVLVIALVLFVSSFFIVPLVGTEFVPETDEGFISLRLNTPIGSSLEYTDAKAHQAEDVLKSFPEVVIA